MNTGGRGDPERKADLILHPVRMRIIQCLVGGTPRSAQQLQTSLPDVPQATLYRHLKKLSDAGVVAIAEERPNRGTVERWYTLPEHAAVLTANDMQEWSADDHLTYFMKFVSHMIGQYGRYIRRPDADLVEDGVSYRQITLQLTKEEHLQLLTSIRDLLLEAGKQEATPERRGMVYTFAVFPD